MSKIKFLQHFSLYCRDLPAMHKFYNEILGLPEMPRPHFPFPGYWFEAGQDHQIHLAKVSDTHVKHSISDNEDSYMDHHIGMVTENLDGMKERLKAHDIPFHDEPYGYPQIFFRDPENNLIEVASTAMFDME